jgi:hypothetical protein
VNGNASDETLVLLLCRRLSIAMDIHKGRSRHNVVQRESAINFWVDLAFEAAGSIRDINVRMTARRLALAVDEAFHELGVLS